MGDINRLREEALSKYKNISQFASKIGWSRNKTSRILSGLQKPDLDDILDLVECLGIDSEEKFTHIFFPFVTTKWTSVEIRKEV